MALTPAQIAAIKKQAPKNIATRAAFQAKKISNKEAAGVAEKARKTGTNNYRGVAPGSNAESAAAKATRAAQEKKNADLEKHRRFAKGEKPLATKNRVGTKAEYRVLGKEINTKAALHKKAAEIVKKKPAAVAPKAAVEAPKVAAEAPKTASTTRASAQPKAPKTSVAKTSTSKAVEVAKKPIQTVYARPVEEVASKAKELTQAAKGGALAKNAKTAGTVAKFVKSARVAASPTPLGLAVNAGVIGVSELMKLGMKGVKPGHTSGKSSTTGRGGGGAMGWIEDKPKKKTTTTAPWGKPGNAPGTAAVKPTVKSSGKYRVEHGDTLSGIAKRAGVTLAELRSANPQLAGKGIFRNTGVNIPKGGTKPTPGYTGSVPYKAPKK